MSFTIHTYEIYSYKFVKQKLKVTTPWEIA